MKYKYYGLHQNYPSPSNGPVISTRCPHCGHNGTFHSLQISKFIKTEVTGMYYWFGQAYCPNASCKGHIFYITQEDGILVRTYPGDTIPFDKTNIPKNVLNAFEEAVDCYSNNCYVASGIMIRKTLEVLCEENGASGNNLFQKVKDIGTKILIPIELIEAMDELRILGNDAAHVEAKTYDQIGKQEIEISIEFVKEILKALYQYESLLSRLRGLKTAGKGVI